MTREEAINLVKQVLPCLNIDEKIREGFETLIPELAESEDERVRRIIHLALIASENELSAFYKTHNITREECTAWLKKQKETFKDGEGMYYYDGERVIFTGYQIVPLDNPYDFAMSQQEEKQKEQKLNSLIYDKDLDKAAREFYLSGGADSPVDSTGLVPIVRMAEFGATWMKERMEKEKKSSIFPPGLGEVRWNPISPSSVKQKPEGVYVDCTEHPEWYGMPPKEQKQEWSEEDEDMRLEAIRVLVSGCERYHKESGCLPSWHKVIDWLKSRRKE